MWYSLLFFGSLASATTAMVLPDYMNSCSRNDPNLKACALKSAQESLHRFSLGDAGRGLNPLDPLYVAEMTVYIPNKQGFRVIFKDNYFKGLSDMHMESLNFDMENKIIIADALVTLDVENTYDLSGRFLVLPITSNGDSHINLSTLKPRPIIKRQFVSHQGAEARQEHGNYARFRFQRGIFIRDSKLPSGKANQFSGITSPWENTLLHIRFWYEDVEGDDGKIHWKIYKHDIKYQVEKASFRLENLLNDKNIGDQINRVLNEMWREIVAEVGPTICQSLSAAVVENLAVLLGQVSFDEMFPE